MKTYEVIVPIYGGDKVLFSRMAHKGRTEWKDKRTAERHAREYKAKHMQDAWVQEINF